MKKIIKLFVLLIFSYSCKSSKETISSLNGFSLLNKVNYTTTYLTDSLETNNKLSDILNNKEITFLNNFSNSNSLLHNFNNVECVGCDNSFANYKPIYKIKKGNYVHFGLKSGLGIKHFIFSKKGNFITQLYTYQGYSKLALANAIPLEKYNIATAIYPTKLTSKEIYLDYLQYSNQTTNNWYNTSLPLHFKLLVNFKETATMRFIFNGGLYSLQGKDAKNKYRIFNFFEPKFTSLKENSNRETALVNGYYANASFYLINLNYNTEVAIKIKANHKNELYDFSIIKNSKYLTIDEYLTLDIPKFHKIKKTLKKGSYLIRVINKHDNENKNYNTTNYTLNILKTTKKQ